MAQRSAKAAKLLRMKDLIAETGLTRDTIHFYITEGLVPPAKRKRRNMAWYGSEHLERLNAIKRLQQERFLPLKAIKEVLGGGRRHASPFTGEQQRLIESLQREMLSEAPATAGLSRVKLSGTELLALFDAAEIDALAERGVIELERDGEDIYVSGDDKEILEGLAAVKQVVDRPEGSWQPDDWAYLDKLATQLIDYEISVFASRFQTIGSRPIDEVVDTTIPVINRVFGILHMKKIRRFLLAFAPSDPLPEEDVGDEHGGPPSAGDGEDEAD
jgi:DNA-binding transcriptional MerR regulator